MLTGERYIEKAVEKIFNNCKLEVIALKKGVLHPWEVPGVAEPNGPTSIP